jgi:AAA+ superfamily predicted ATPase
VDAWLENNNRYLEASLEWLRLRLQRLIREVQASSGTATPSASDDYVSRPASRGFLKWMGTAPATQNKVRLLPAGKPPSLDEQVAEALAAREAAAMVDPPPALVMLANLFALSAFERDTLLLCAALDFDPTLASLCGAALGNPSRNYPTFSLALSLFDEPRWDALCAQTPLRYSRLLEISQPGAVALTAAALRADERIVNFLKGINVLDDRLSTLVNPVDSTHGMGLAASQRAIVDDILQRLQAVPQGSILPVVQLRGGDEGSALAIARLVCATVGRQLYSTEVETLPSQIADIETMARLWHRESFLLPLALYIQVENLDGDSTETNAALHRILSREIGLIFLSVPDTALRLNRPSLIVEVQRPTPAEQCELWTSLLNATASETEVCDTAKALVGQFDFSVNDILEAASLASNCADAQIQTSVWRACRNVTRPRLDSLAQRLKPKATWDDLVLPEEQMSLMRQIAGQVRNRHKVYDEWGFSRSMNRGFGINALFSGESGTGKTMAAEVLANDLQLNLYRIDLSAVVSKYIGETEKNLRKLFDGAERGGSILLFDEADALFGKRSEVKDSHDRYANIEINYLLQRMEAFRGLAILATNMKSSLDAAFMRRLRFIVNLPFPGIKERKLIWQKALPPQTPTRGLDYERLARLSLSGGNIHSIALNAAFIAAQNGQTVTMPILTTAVRAELKKLEKGYSESELRLIEGVRNQA